MALDALGQLEGAVAAHGDLRRSSWPCSGSPLTYQRPVLPLQVVGVDLEHGGGDDPGLAPGPCCATMAAAAPDTGVEREP